MSTNHTPNYGLCQWEAGDKVLRTDFNADNAAIDTELGILDTSVTNLAYHAGYAALENYMKTHEISQHHGLVCDDFSKPAFYTITGGVTPADNMLTLTETDKIVTLTTPNLSVDLSSWRKAMLWVHFVRANVEVSVNGIKMNTTFDTPSYTPNKKLDCVEQLFTLDLETYQRSGKITFQFFKNSAQTAYIYDWFAFFA